MSLDTVAMMQNVPVGKSAAAAPRPSLGQTLDETEARYMQGTREPATSSVLISNSRYLNSPASGIAVGLALEKPLFLVEWEQYLDWQLDDIAAHLGFARGPAQGWDWTIEATTG
jgi:hypothetical protein